MPRHKKMSRKGKKKRIGRGGGGGRGGGRVEDTLPGYGNLGKRTGGSILSGGIRTCKGSISIEGNRSLINET